MKTKTTIAATMLIMMTLAAAAAPPRGEGEETQRVQSITGAWRVKVRPDPIPGAPAPFTAYFTYDLGEGFVETDSLAGGNGHGSWQRVSRDAVRFRMIRPLLDPSGKVLGSFDVIENIVIDGDSYEGDFVAKLLDPDGNLLGIFPGHTSGERIVIEGAGQ